MATTAQTLADLVEGINALEGTFLGGCIFSGCAAGRALAAAT